MKSPPDIFFFILVIAVKDNFFDFLTIWKEAFPREETHILLLKDFYNLVHLITILEVEKEAPFRVDKICRASFWNKSKRQSIFHCDTVADCKAQAVGHKICGGPEGYLIMSTKDPNYGKISAEINLLNYMDAGLQRKLSVMGTCDYNSEPTLACEKGVCTKK
jgi:hypothetical protein